MGGWSALRVAGLAAVLAACGACSRWAYAPTWKGAGADGPVRLAWDGGSRCGELTVRNTSAETVTVRWDAIRAGLAGERRRPTEGTAPAGARPVSGRQALAPGASVTGGLCTDLRLFVVRTRPLTGWDVGLGWFYGIGVLAGNVVWEPKRARIERIVDRPRSYAWELEVPVRTAQGEVDAVLEVRGSRPVAFKYTRRVHGQPDALERSAR